MSQFQAGSRRSEGGFAREELGAGCAGALRRQPLSSAAAREDLFARDAGSSSRSGCGEPPPALFPDPQPLARKRRPSSDAMCNPLRHLRGATGLVAEPSLSLGPSR